MGSNMIVVMALIYDFCLWNYYYKLMEIGTEN